MDLLELGWGRSQPRSIHNENKNGNLNNHTNKDKGKHKIQKSMKTKVSHNNNNTDATQIYYSQCLCASIDTTCGNVTSRPVKTINVRKQSKKASEGSIGS